MYLTSLARRPLLTKACTSFACVIIGDSIAQAIGGAPYSIIRVLRLAAYSSTVGASCGHYWHRWLETTIHPEAPQCHAAVVKKTALDQLVLSPVMCAVFFTALKLFEGNPAGILPFLQASREKWLPTVCTSMAVWGPYNLASFRFIPEHLRVLCGNCAGIAWGCYMSVSCINQAPSAACAAAAAATAALQASQVQE
ncbi:hypothetical protein COHA_009439 [Chlorella ohadii]|uniref:Uncharacterized protein n=1 Tax=Chlorella ohadii TaxID=2649997 RepID=A0AAD5DHT3_9CHLO|nr:hypothetical protein COHA_009439 [Chlorella ohadii]